jgi:hypothetical protein
MHRRPKISAKRQHLSASGAAPRASSCVRRMVRGGDRRRMRRRCRHVSTSVNTPRWFGSGRRSSGAVSPHHKTRTAKHLGFHWLSLVFFGSQPFAAAPCAGTARAKAACRRSRFTCPNSRARRAGKGVDRLAQPGHWKCLVQNKNKVNSRFSRSGCIARWPAADAQGKEKGPRLLRDAAPSFPCGSGAD